MTDHMAKAFGRAAALSFLDWRYFAIAVKELFLARFRLATQPAGTVLRALMHDAQASSGGRGDVPSDIDIPRLRWAINAAAPRMPWRCDCLPRALAADRWLRRHRLQPQFFLGVGKDAAGRLEAHAWLRYQGNTVIGGDGRNFTVFLGPGSGDLHGREAIRKDAGPFSSLICEGRFGIPAGGNV